MEPKYIKLYLKELIERQKVYKAGLRQPHDSETWRTQIRSQTLRERITCVLIFYHEARGSDGSLHHGEVPQYCLDKRKNELQDWLKKYDET